MEHEILYTYLWVKALLVLVVYIQPTFQQGNAPCDGWILDEKTGEMYLILNTTTLAHDVNRDQCLHNGGNLPEPRSKEQNDFLHDLNTKMFLLGMSDSQTEGTWLWDSDNTPVIYTNWHDIHGATNGATSINCAVMMKHYEKGQALWGDLPCRSNSYMDGFGKSLICQRTKVCPEGKFGNMCEHDCHCLNSEACDRDSGHCESGCAPILTGEDCRQSKPITFSYGILVLRHLSTK